MLTIGLKKILVSVIQLSSQLKLSLGWDPSRLIKICRSLTRFLFGVGSVTPQTDFSSGWDLSHLYTVHTYMAFVRVKSLNLYVHRILLIGSFLLHYVGMLSMPQVFEQSLFLFSIEQPRP